MRRRQRKGRGPAEREEGHGNDHDTENYVAADNLVDAISINSPGG